MSTAACICNSNNKGGRDRRNLVAYCLASLAKFSAVRDCSSKTKVDSNQGKHLDVNLWPPHMHKYSIHPQGLSVQASHALPVISSMVRINIKKKPGSVRFSSIHSTSCVFSAPDTAVVYEGQRWVLRHGYSILAQKSKRRSA